MTANPLYSHHLRQLVEESGIPEDIIAARGYRTAESKADLTEAGFKKVQAKLYPALIVPLYNWRGEQTLCQMRPDKPRQDAKGKIKKYEFPYGAQMMLDVPPIPWVQADIMNHKKPLMITEGSKKADAAVGKGILCASLCGVWNWKGKNQFGSTTVIPELADDIPLKDRVVAICYDSDAMEKKEVLVAMTRLGQWIKSRGGKVKYIYLPYADDGKKVGLDDWLVDNPGAKMGTLMAMGRTEAKEIPGQSFYGAGSATIKLADILKGRLAYDNRAHKWRVYNDPGVWVKEDTEVICCLIADEFEKHGVPLEFHQPMQIERMARGRLATNFNRVDPNLLPFSNGVLDLTTMELHPYTPDQLMTWHLPYPYAADATCEPIMEWLDHFTGGNTDDIRILHLFAGATVRGMSGIQKYLELVGAGGTGKSTWMRMMQALVGKGNCHVTSFEALVSNRRFEPAAVMNKRLVCLPDQKSFTKDLSLFKNITGGDDINYELKGVQVDPEKAFTYRGTCIVTSNKPITTTDPDSGFNRRRIIVNFNIHPKGTPMTMLDFDADGQPYGELVPHLSGFLNWALEPSKEEIYQELHEAARIQETKVAALEESNPLVAWIMACLVQDEEGWLPNRNTRRLNAPEAITLTPDGKTMYGVVQVVDGQYEHLYASYWGFCLEGNLTPLASTSFPGKLEDTLASIKWEGAKRVIRKGVRGFKGIRIKMPWD